MQNLRDKLLKVGLVDKKQKQQVDTQARRERKQQGQGAEQTQEEARRAAFEEKRRAEAEAQRRLEEERARERVRRERQNQVRSIADHWAIRQSRPGQHPFYFVQRSGRIGRLLVSAPLRVQLSAGAVAIVERLLPEEAAVPVPRRRRGPLEALLRERRGAEYQAVEAYVLCPWEAAERILKLDESAVRFWARQQDPVGVFAEDPAELPGDR